MRSIGFKGVIAAAILAAAIAFFMSPVIDVSAEVDPPCGQGHLTNNLPSWAIDQGIETCEEFDTLQAQADQCRAFLAETFGVYGYRFYTADGQPTADTAVYFAALPDGTGIFCIGADQVHGLACAVWNNDPEQRSPTFTAEECEQFARNSFFRSILIDARGMQGRISNPTDPCYGLLGSECDRSEDAPVVEFLPPDAGSGGLLEDPVQSVLAVVALFIGVTLSGILLGGSFSAVWLLKRSLRL